MDELDYMEVLRSADPFPETAPVDRHAHARALNRIREVVRMETTHKPRRRLVIAVAATCALVAVAVVVGVSQLGTGDSTGVAAGTPLASGSTMASCLQFSEAALAQAPIAFDGTVTTIDGERVTLEVERWYRGGEGDTITLVAPDLTGTSLVGSGVGFEDGERYLVSAYRDADAIVPSLCGFSVTYSTEMADTFQRAFA